VRGFTGENGKAARAALSCIKKGDPCPFESPDHLALSLFFGEPFLAPLIFAPVRGWIKSGVYCIAPQLLAGHRCHS
jgi:hypothetical protein